MKAIHKRLSLLLQSVLLLFLSPLFSQDPIPMRPLKSYLSWDLQMSPYAGGEDLLFALRLIEFGETRYFKNSPLTMGKEKAAQFFRLVEMLSIWFPADFFTMVLENEVFGHGYRVRDLHLHHMAKTKKIFFKAPPPYNSGYAKFTFQVLEKFSTTGASTISCAGIEASQILAKEMKMKWISSRTLDPRQAALYFVAEQNLTLYAMHLSKLKAQNVDGSDVSEYVQNVNYTYPTDLLTKNNIQNLSYFNFLDPMTFYAIYSWFYYVNCGKEGPIPMIYSNLPNLRFTLTPFGPQWVFENYFLIKDLPAYAYFSYGTHSKNRYLGIGFHIPSFIEIKKFSIGVRGDLWKQPKLLLFPGNVPFEEIDFEINPQTLPPLYSESDRRASEMGGALSVIGEYTKDSIGGFQLELGYKAEGYLAGYSLFSYPTVRTSLFFIF
jgi:hypothetical protein